MIEYDEEESLSQLIFKIEGFEGPIDKLNELIKAKNIEIKDVKIAELTDQYIQYLENSPEMDMEDTTAFLLMASYLLELKSKSLLPVETTDDEEELSEEEQFKLTLIRREEYLLLKKAGEDLHEVENIDRFYKQPDKSAGDPRIVFNQFNLDKLLDAFAFILMRTKDKENPPEKKVVRDRWTVADKISFLTKVLEDNKEINFFELFDDTYTKLEKITVFLAVLEMLKFQKIEVVQKGRYEDFVIRQKEVQEETDGH